MSSSGCWMTMVGAASGGGWLWQRTRGVGWAGRLAWRRGERGRKEECFAGLAFWHVCRGEDNVAWNAKLGNSPSPTGTEVFCPRRSAIDGICELQVCFDPPQLSPQRVWNAALRTRHSQLLGSSHTPVVGTITGDYLDCQNRQIGQTASATFARPGGSRLRWHVSADCRGVVQSRRKPSDDSTPDTQRQAIIISLSQVPAVRGPALPAHHPGHHECPYHGPRMAMRHVA